MVATAMRPEPSRYRKQTLPCCGYSVDSATIVGNEGATPRAGDLSVCMGCGCWHRFADDQGTLRPFLAEDYLDKDLDEETLAVLRKATAVIRQRRAMLEQEKEAKRGRRKRHP
jgi:hypothetical protein